MFGYYLFCWKLKIIKKIISRLLFTSKKLFICLFALFMSHKHCNRHWSKKKKKPKAPDTHWTWSKRILSVTWIPYQETIKSLPVVKHVYSLFFPIDEYFSFILIRGLLRFTVIENLIVPFMNWLCKLGFIVKMFVSITLS